MTNAIPGRLVVSNVFVSGLRSKAEAFLFALLVLLLGYVFHGSNNCYYRPVRINLKCKGLSVRNKRPNKLGKVSGWFIWILAVLLLVSSGITYRLLASHLEILSDTPILLPVPLGNFPTQVGNWVGRDLAIPNTTKEYMEENFADDFMSRRYINAATKAWADVYIVYCSSRPGGILGHQPQVCYPAHGWIPDSTEPSHFISAAGQQIPCLINRFHKPAPTYDQKLVLNFYILNGQITTNENDFSGPLGRRPNIAGDPARYVAQVQISSVLENSIRTIAKDITDLVLDYLPDQKGKVQIVEYSSLVDSVLK